MLPVQ
jgi:cell division protein FtsL